MSDYTLLLMVGLPRSGKTTQARKIARERGVAVMIVSPDAIRMALHGQPYIPTAEPLIWAMARIQAHAAFIAGHEYVIIDATNTTVKRRAEWVKLAKGIPGCETAALLCGATMDLCLRRAVADGREDLIPPIERMNDEQEEIDEEAEDIRVLF